MKAPCTKLYLSPRSLYQRPPGATTWQEQTGCHRRTDTLRHGPVIGHETDGDNHSPTSSLPLSLFAMGTSYRITRAWTTDTRYGMSAESVSLSQISSDIINTVTQWDRECERKSMCWSNKHRHACVHLPQTRSNAVVHHRNIVLLLLFFFLPLFSFSTSTTETEGKLLWGAFYYKYKQCWG